MPSQYACSCTKWLYLQGWRLWIFWTPQSYPHQGWSRYCQYWVSNMPSAKTNGEWHSSPGDQPVTRWQVDYIRSSWSWSDQWFVTIGLDTHFTYIFAILTQTSPAKATIDGLTEYLIQDCSIPYDVASNQGTYFITKEGQTWAHTEELIGLKLRCS